MLRARALREEGATVGNGWGEESTERRLEQDRTKQRRWRRKTWQAL